MNNELILKEQKGCCKGARGCKDNLLLSKAILQDCRARKKNLSMAWIDYQKAFDSVPHSWLIKSMELIGVHQKVISICQKLITTWQTKIYLRSAGNQIVTDSIKIKRGIYQGDSLSPLLFCIALVPLSNALEKLDIGYKLTGSQTPLSHLLYMDDLKLIGKNEEQLSVLLNTTTEFSQDINMKFGLDKCATINFKRGKQVQARNVPLANNDVIMSIEPNQYYKYLGITEGEDIDHVGVKNKLKKEYCRRTRKVLKSELNAKNKILALNTLAVPVLTYSFGIVNWSITEIRKIDRKTRKILTMYGGLHPRSDIHRLYVSRNNGGRGLKQIENTFKIEAFSLASYVVRRAQSDYLISALLSFDRQQKPRTSLVLKGLEVYKNTGGQIPEQEVYNTIKVTDIRKKLQSTLEEEWRNKALHGQVLREMSNLAVEKRISFSWLRRANIKIETESLITAAQEQALNTRYYEWKIIKTRNDGRCRMCNDGNETVQHILSACPILARNEYIARHNRVCNLLHFNLCQYYEIECDTKRWYEHHAKPVVSNTENSITILYDHQIQTDRTIAANKPDLVIRKPGETLIIDVAVPADRNVTQKEAEKILKYKDLAIDVQRMWRTKVKIVPIIIGATGFVTNNFRRHLNTLPGNHSPDVVQKTALLGSAHILRKILS